jgi:ATP-dependent Zn protease
VRRTFNPWLVVMLIILGIFVFNQFGASGTPREINFSTFTQLVDEGRVSRVTIERNNGVIDGELRGWRARSSSPASP